MEWSRAQLGQFTKFFTGNDQGWRGEILLDMTLTGTPAKLQIATNGSIQDFRRYDITNGQALRLAGHCDGEYSSLDHTFRSLLCSAPAAGGMITLKGDMGLPGSHSYGLVLTAANVPVSAATVVVQRMKRNLPDDLVASGVIGGSLRIDAERHYRLEGSSGGTRGDCRLSYGFGGEYRRDWAGDDSLRGDG